MTSNASSSKDLLARNLENVRRRLETACQRSQRDPSSVTLICVTKGVALERMREVVALGVRDLGENRVQEARAKQEVLGTRSKVQGASFQDQSLEPCTLSLAPIRWHLIGHLQRNKAKAAAQCFQMIHSVDSAALARELERHAAKQQAQGASLKAQGHTNLEPCALNLEPIQVFIQVNVSDEATKFGCTPAEAPQLADTITQLPHLWLRGLMTIAPFSDDPEDARPSFRRLRMLRDETEVALHLAPCTLRLSMGMSQDFEAAIEEGADFVRIGTAIFGDRRPETGDRRLEK